MLRCLLLPIAGFCLLFCAAAAQAADLMDVTINAENERTSLQLKFSESITPKIFTISTGTPRVIIDIPQTEMGSALKKKAKGKNHFAGNGGIEKLRFARRGKKDLRLVADLHPDMLLISNTIEDKVLSVVLVSEAVVPAVPVAADGLPTPSLKPKATLPETVKVAATPQKTLSNENYDADIPVPNLKNRSIVRHNKKPIIVIDPGHGGYDPGAVGKKKVKEENVTLAAAKELRRQLLATGRYTVVLTRDRDIYIAHEERVRIARKAGANLFISIHADSTSKSTTRGASVYTLADRAQKRSQEVIGTQNWVLDVDLSDQSEQVGDILVDLAQRKTLTKSAQFADILLPELAKHSAMVGNSHRRAGYYVLLAPDVPAVLLEMGFLSNEKDERLINSAHHRKNLMKAVTIATNEYFRTQRQLQASR